MNNVYLYIIVMAVVTYLIRVLPLTLIRGEIRNPTIRSFFYYTPYVTLSVMTFPSIIHATGSIITGSIGFITALALAWYRCSMFVVAGIACAIVFISGLFIN